jgi:chromosome segregation ATPase
MENQIPATAAAEAARATALLRRDLDSFKEAREKVDVAEVQKLRQDVDAVQADSKVALDSVLEQVDGLSKLLADLGEFQSSQSAANVELKARAQDLEEQIKAIAASEIEAKATAVSTQATAMEALRRELDDFSTQASAMQAIRQELEDLKEAREKVDTDVEKQMNAFSTSLATVVEQQEAHVAKAESLSEQTAELQRLRQELDVIQAADAEDASAKANFSSEQAAELQKFREECGALQADSKAAIDSMIEEAGGVKQLRADFDVFQSNQRAANAELKARMEGGFDAMLVQLEAERWLRGQVDSVADRVTQDMVGVLDKTCDQLATRVLKVEKNLADQR